MAELKTKPTHQSVMGFLAGVDDESKRKDSEVILKIMKEATGVEPNMWGSSMVGFGSLHYKYESGREGDWPVTGFSPRKQNLTIYIMPGFSNYQELLQKLGKHKTGKSCLYIKRLSDIDLAVLQDLIKQSVLDITKSHSSTTPP